MGQIHPLGFDISTNLTRFHQHKLIIPSQTVGAFQRIQFNRFKSNVYFRQSWLFELKSEFGHMSPFHPLNFHTYLINIFLICQTVGLDSETNRLWDCFNAKCIDNFLKERVEISHQNGSLDVEQHQMYHSFVSITELRKSAVQQSLVDLLTSSVFTWLFVCLSPW